MFRFYTEEGRHFSDGKMRHSAEFFFAGDHSIKARGHTKGAALAALKSHLEIIHRKSAEGLQKICAATTQSRPTDDAPIPPHGQADGVSSEHSL